MPRVREVKIREFTENLGDGKSSSQYKVVGSQGSVDPLIDLIIVMEGLALLTRVAAKYQEQEMAQTKKQVVEYLSQAFERHDGFKFISTHHGKDIPKPSN